MSANLKSTFRHRLKQREPLLGTMLKLPTSHPTEILSDVGFDFVVVDQEHSPFDRATTDIVLLASRAAQIPALVRVSSLDMVLSALDCGATGVVVPHVSSAAYAREVAAACRYRRGKRGYATSTRAGGYTSIPMARHIRESDEMVTVIAQIEEPPGLEELDAIAAVEGIDALFIGRNDLAIAFGEELADSPVVQGAAERIAASALAAGKAMGVFVTGPNEIERFTNMGATGFIVASDQGFLRLGAAKAVTEIKSLICVQT